MSEKSNVRALCGEPPFPEQAVPVEPNPMFQDLAKPVITIRWMLAMH